MDVQMPQNTIYQSTLNGDKRIRNKIGYNLRILGNDALNLGAGVKKGIYERRGLDQKAHSIEATMATRDAKNATYALNSSLLSLDLEDLAHTDISLNSGLLLDAYSDHLGAEKTGLSKVLNSVGSFGERFVPLVGGYISSGRTTRQQVYGVLSQIADKKVEELTAQDNLSLNGQLSGMTADAKNTLVGLGYNTFVQHANANRAVGFAELRNLTLDEIEVNAKDRLKSTIGKVGPITFDSVLMASGGGYLGKTVLNGLAPSATQLGKLAFNAAGYGTMKLTEIVGNTTGMGIGATTDFVAKKYGTDENGQLTKLGKVVKGSGEFVQGSLITGTKTGLQGAAFGANSLWGLIASGALGLGTVGTRVLSKYAETEKAKETFDWASVLLETGLLTNVGFQAGQQTVEFFQNNPGMFSIAATPALAAGLDNGEQINQATKYLNIKKATENIRTNFGGFGKPLLSVVPESVESTTLSSGPESDVYSGSATDAAVDATGPFFAEFEVGVNRTPDAGFDHTNTFLDDSLPFYLTGLETVCAQPVLIDPETHTGSTVLGPATCIDPNTDQLTIKFNDTLPTYDTAHGADDNLIQYGLVWGTGAGVNFVPGLVNFGSGFGDHNVLPAEVILAYQNNWTANTGAKLNLDVALLDIGGEKYVVPTHEISVEQLPENIYDQRPNDTQAISLLRLNSDPNDQAIFDQIIANNYTIDPNLFQRVVLTKNQGETGKYWYLGGTDEIVTRADGTSKYMFSPDSRGIIQHSGLFDGTQVDIPRHELIESEFTCAPIEINNWLSGWLQGHPTTAQIADALGLLPFYRTLTGAGLETPVNLFYCGPEEAPPAPPKTGGDPDPQEEPEGPVGPKPDVQETPEGPVGPKPDVQETPAGPVGPKPDTQGW